MHEITSFTYNAPEEIVGNAIAFDKQDKKLFKDIYMQWRELNMQLAMMQGRHLSIPGELIEGIVCLHCGMWKVTNCLSKHYDLWDPNAEDGKNRISVRVASGSVFQMFLPHNIAKYIDRVLFVKLYTSKTDSLQYEIYDFDIEQIEQYKSSLHNGRIFIRQEELKNLPYNNIITGEL